MGYLYKQEIFKLLKKRSLWFCLLFIVLQNIGMAIFSQSYSNFFQAKLLFQYDFASTSFIALIMIAASATIISTEFEYNTIKNVVMQPYSRSQVLISKWLTILTYSVGIYLLAMILSLFDKFIFFNTTFSLNDKVIMDFPSVHFNLISFCFIFRHTLISSTYLNHLNLTIFAIQRY